MGVQASELEALRGRLLGFLWGLRRASRELLAEELLEQRLFLLPLALLLWPRGRRARTGRRPR